MLPKQNRLKKDKDFQTLFKKGKNVYGPLVGVKWQTNDLEVSRFAVVVGTKVSKSAVKRGTLRRRVREIIRLRMENMKPGYDGVFVVSKEAIGKTHEELESAVEALLAKSPFYGK